MSLLLEDELAAEEEVEAPLAAELHYTHVAYVETAEEQATVARYKLDRVPPALEAQLQQYKDWRLQPLNFQRAGNAVVDTTAYAPRAGPLRTDVFFFCALSRVTACAAVRYRALHAADSGDRVAQGERHGDGAALPRLRQGGPRSVAQPQGARHRRAAHHRASLARADGRARSHVVVAEQLRQLAVQPRRLVVGLGRCRRGGGVRARPAAADGADPAPRAVRAAEQAAAPLRQEAGQLDRLGHGAGGAPQVRARVGRRGAARARCKDRAALGVPRAALPHRHAARRAPSNLCPSPCSHPAQGRTQPCPLLARSAWASSASCAGATR